MPVLCQATGYFLPGRLLWATHQAKTEAHIPSSSAASKPMHKVQRRQNQSENRGGSPR